MWSRSLRYSAQTWKVASPSNHFAPFNFQALVCLWQKGRNEVALVFCATKQEALKIVISESGECCIPSAERDSFFVTRNRLSSGFRRGDLVFPIIKHFTICSINLKSCIFRPYYYNFKVRLSSKKDSFKYLQNEIAYIWSFSFKFVLFYELLLCWVGKNPKKTQKKEKN